MTLLLRSMVQLPCIKESVSSIYRTEIRSRNLISHKIPCRRVTTKLLSNRRLLYLPGYTLMGQCNIGITANRSLMNGIACRSAFPKIYFSSTFIHKDLRPSTPYWVSTSLFHSISKRNKEELNSSEKNPEKSTNLIKKLKLMIKRYWYIYIPVHGITSIIWFGGFYYAIKSGLDVTPFIEKINYPWLTDLLENSNTGYYAIAAAMYKIISPIRYAVTVGVIAASVKVLRRMGYIKEEDITKQELKHIYNDKKVELIVKTDEIRERYKTKSTKLINKYKTHREEMSIKNRKRIKYWRDIYSARAKRGEGELRGKKKNGNGRKNGIKSVIYGRNGNGIGKGSNGSPLL